MAILTDGTFWLSLSSLVLVCCLSTLKVIHTFKCVDFNCCGLSVHRDIETEASIDKNLERVPLSRRNSVI